VITLKSSKLVPLECVMVSGPKGILLTTKKTVEERVKVAVNTEYPEQTVMIGSTLSEEGRNKLCDLLQRNLDIFAWKHADMTDVPRHITEHRLNIREGCPPVRQKKKGQAADINQEIQKEVGKLVEARIMKEKGTAKSGKEMRNLQEGQSISYPNGKDKGIEGPMIIKAEIGGHCIHRMYVDGGSASEILYEHCFNRLGPKIKSQLMPATTLLIGFIGEIIWPIGQIQLLVKIGDEEHSTAAWMNFVVVRSPSLYNVIIGRPGVRKLQVVSSTAHEMMKLRVEGGVITLKSSKLVPLECVMVSGPKGILLTTKKTVEERVKVAVNTEYPEQTVMIGSTLSEEGRNKLCDLLQ
nr:reverse transcriptase domain-containing protein [Tanacetum cinerariifolium]